MDVVEFFKKPAQLDRVDRYESSQVPFNARSLWSLESANN